MPAVIVSAEVEDGKTWEERFRTRVDFFRRYTIQKPVRFAVDRNRFTVCFEPEDLDTFMKSIKSDETAKAMAEGGVKRETLEITVLDKSIDV